MKKSILVACLLCVLLFLSSCQAESAIPAPTATVPPPTATPVPSPTPTPEPTPIPEMTLEVYGAEFSNYCEELDLSGVPVDDAGAALEALLPQMPKLKTVIMSDCGVSDEDMDALNRRWENIRFLWTIYFGQWYYLRTDATSFIASLFQNNQSYYSDLSNEEVMKLRYCTDMVALDLGHMSFTTCEFVRDMPNLRYFIIADTPVEDLSPLAGLENLWYLEIFGSKATDISPLLECPALRHLNISWCFIENPELLFEMTYLERLWYMSPSLTWELYEELPLRLPDTELQLGMTGSSVGGTWRSHPAYFEMRDAFGVFYISPP